MMNTTNRTDTLKIGGEGRWSKSIQACQKMVARFNELADQLADRLAEEVAGWMPEHLVRRAVKEAEALASSTPYPLLFLPVLAEEKVLSARHWANRQQKILERQRRLHLGV